MTDMVQNSSVPILVVEDNRTQGEYLRYVLEKEGYPVTIATNGKEALISISTSRPHLILTDVMMPEMDGYEAIGKMKSNTALQKIPVIAITAQAMTGDREKCLEAGADGYISKPVNVDELLVLLKKLID